MVAAGIWTGTGTVTATGSGTGTEAGTEIVTGTEPGIVTETVTGTEAVGTARPETYTVTERGGDDRVPRFTLARRSRAAASWYVPTYLLMVNGAVQLNMEHHIFCFIHDSRKPCEDSWNVSNYLFYVV